MFDFGEIKFASFIDYKRIVKDKTRVALGKLPVYRALSSGMKKPVPVFCVLTYLDPDYETKMFYVIPADPLSENYFAGAGKSKDGIWCSMKEFSKLQHSLRARKWNGEEAIKDKDIQAILTLDPTAPLTLGMKLKDLPSQKTKYFLPDLSHIK